jgi:hypothetical protein
MPRVRQSLRGTKRQTLLLTLQRTQSAFYTSPFSSFAQHLLDEAHPFGLIHDIVQVLQHRKEGPHLNTMEKFHIYTEYINGYH